MTTENCTPTPIADDAIAVTVEYAEPSNRIVLRAEHLMPCTTLISAMDTVEFDTADPAHVIRQALATATRLRDEVRDMHRQRHEAEDEAAE